MTQFVINSDINILGGLPTWGLVEEAVKTKWEEHAGGTSLSRTHIKTARSIDRFQSAINKSLLSFESSNLEHLYQGCLQAEGVTNETLLLLFWNGSYNNYLLRLINQNVLFPALFSGRATIGLDDVLSYLQELRNTNESLKSWGKSTIETTASKYLTLLTKFGLLSGHRKRTIEHPFYSDSLFVTFLYWLSEVETNTNIFESEWLQYCFSEKQPFIDRLLQPKFSKYVHIAYSPINLKIKPLLKYSDLYHELTQSS